MRRLKLATALSTFCFLSACAERTLIADRPPADRLDCVYVRERPAIPAEYVIDWSKVVTVAQAKAEHETYVSSIRSREGVIVGYIVDLEGTLFACSNDAAWLRDYYEELPR